MLDVCNVKVAICSIILNTHLKIKLEKLTKRQEMNKKHFFVGILRARKYVNEKKNITNVHCAVCTDRHLR